MHLARWSLHALSLLCDRLYLLKRFEPLAQQGTPPPIRRAATPGLSFFEKTDKLLTSLQHKVPMFGQLSCSIGNDDLGLTFWQRPSDTSLWRNRCLFWAGNTLLDFLKLRTRSSLPKVTVINFGRLSGRHSEACGVTYKGLSGQRSPYIPHRCGSGQLSSETDTVLPALISVCSAPCSAWTKLSQSCKIQDCPQPKCSQAKEISQLQS